MTYYIYLILAVLFFTGEIFVMEFSLTCIGLGLLGSAAASLLGWGPWGQTLAFIAVALVAFIGVRPFALKYLYRRTKHVKTNVERLIGREALVEIAIDPIENTGRVRVEGGESWRASADNPIAQNTVVVVEKVEGVTVFVKPK